MKNVIPLSKILSILYNINAVFEEESVGMAGSMKGRESDVEGGCYSMRRVGGEGGYLDQNDYVADFCSR